MKSIEEIKEEIGIINDHIEDFHIDKRYLLSYGGDCTTVNLKIAIQNSRKRTLQWVLR